MSASFISDGRHPPIGDDGPGFYAAAMNDALWDTAFARLVAGQRAPDVVWPPERVRHVRGLSGDRIDDDDLPLRHCPPSVKALPENAPLVPGKR